MEKPFLLYEFEKGDVVGLAKFSMVKKKRNHTWNLVYSYVILPHVAVVWLSLETFQTLVESQSQASAYFEEVDGGPSHYQHGPSVHGSVYGEDVLDIIFNEIDWDFSDPGTVGKSEVTETAATHESICGQCESSGVSVPSSVISVVDLAVKGVGA